MTQKGRNKWMKKFYLLSFFIFLLAGINDGLYAQEQAETPTRLLRIYEDNDFMNIRGKPTDDAYTAGTRIDLFYTRENPSHFFLDRILPKAGDSSVNVFSWGVMQLLFTPDDLSNPDYQPNDYPWSASLTASHSLYSYNPQKKYDFQTELVLGVVGPAALGGPTQKLVHHILQFEQPQGWSHQFRNSPLVNINFTAEKELAAWGPYVEVIGGGQVSVGSMQNSVAVYPLIRIGKFTPYFNGFFSQYTGPGRQTGGKRKRRLQMYFLLKPQAQLVFTNALLEGGLFTTNPNLKVPGKGDSSVTGQTGTPVLESEPPQPYHDIRRLICSVTYGGVVSTGHFGVSFTQTTASSMMKGLYDHDVENVSIYYAW
ncbi:MAG TPA: lipid A-modifier LpxR family protein [Puia sp.]|nr:lipid A-modifier LpxR family protein [Puia sp.]